ncbi:BRASSINOSTEROID INSENSITIVE 1-associated receptor kinase 1-like [Rhodamnia argentea]|uniref:BRASSINOSTEROID INSENSITIVE 1-associated receptor kinase 1-like n=1 Tax=Rhodamnia argentea TaxID=178133 RepID=A0A8B8N6I9_9MYRT|nr:BRASSINOSTEROID INSENSITIVE 1-associated receptor kinase 1-like [Rhodamnia argentea]
MVFNLRTSSFTESDEDDPTPPKTFSLKELRVATHDFSSNNIVGQYWDAVVYRGRLANGSLVAVKRAHCVDPQKKEEFEAAMKVGSTISRHPNVLCLRGFCRTKKELLLVYPLMVNNSLSYHLRERPDRFARPLDWTTRKRIALGAARGLAHLHNQGNIKVLHRDIRSYNILLNEHFEAVIGGFALAMIMHEGNVETVEWRTGSADSGSDSPSYQPYEDVYVESTVRGVLGFIAPEYFWTGKCTLKNDVFAYGKMLLELISGKSVQKPFSSADGENLTFMEWIGGFLNENELGRVIDPNLQGNCVEEEAAQLIRLALSCAHEDPSVRLEMPGVVGMLKSQFLQQDPSSRSSWSQSEYDSTPYYSFPPSPSPPSPQGIAR